MEDDFELQAEENDEDDEQDQVELAEHLPIRCDTCQELSDELQSIASQIRDHSARVAKRTLFQLELKAATQSRVEAEYRREHELLRARNSTLYALSRHHRREHKGQY